MLITAPGLYAVENSHRGKYMCVNSLLISRATKLNLVLGAELARGRFIHQQTTSPMQFDPETVSLTAPQNDLPAYHSWFSTTLPLTTIPT